MAVKLDEQQWLSRLTTRLTQGRGVLEGWDAYYEGKQSLSYLAPELLAQMGDRLRPVILNWPRLVVESVEERLNVEGFRAAGQDAGDDDLWTIWQSNDLDTESQLAHTDVLAMGRAYAIVGKGDTDVPLITVESPLDVFVALNPRTRVADAAVKLWCEESATGSQIEHATLYLPNRTAWYVRTAGKWEIDPDYEPDDHNMGAVPVVALLNRPRTRNRLGTSELTDVVPLSDAACKAATDMMVSAEFHAMPRRYAIGMGPEDFQDDKGNPLGAWRAVAGRLWATDKTRADGVELGQFDEANLSNFHETINCLARLVASMSGLDPAAMGFTTTAPASADAIRSAESRLIKRVQRKLRVLGGGWERVMQLADRVATGEWRPELAVLETLWGDPETPTVAQSADAAVKLFNLPTPIVPLRQTRERLGFTQTQIALMEEQDAIDAARQAAMFNTPPAADGAGQGDQGAGDVTGDGTGDGAGQPAA